MLRHVLAASGAEERLIAHTLGSEASDMVDAWEALPLALGPGQAG